MTRQPAIVVFGATGYTGGLVVDALVRRGIRPILAARSPDKLDTLAARHGGLPTRQADVTDPASVTALVQRGDVLVTTVGPFEWWGQPAVEAAIAAGAYYLDSTGEGNFVHNLTERHAEAARAAGAALLPAFAYDYVPGNLAAELALRDAGDLARKVEVGYFTVGSPDGGMAISSGTRATITAGQHQTIPTWRDGALVRERPARRVRRFQVEGRVHNAISVFGSESIFLPRRYPHLRDVTVYNGLFGGRSRRLQGLSAAVTAAQKVPGVRGRLDAAATRAAHADRPSSGPDAETRKATPSHVVAVVEDGSGEVLAETHLAGPNGYDLTAELLAWAAVGLAAGAVDRPGVLGPVEAFGLDVLSDACREIGLEATRRP